VYLEQVGALFLQTLGQLAFFLVMHSLNGYMAIVTNLSQPVSKWRCGAVPFTVCHTIFDIRHNNLSFYIDCSLLA
jgi:hypothetical protein